MPRANRYILPGLYYHVTHRCHNKASLLKFDRERNDYRKRLREALAEHQVCLLNYTLTSNHVHLLLQATQESTRDVSRLMQVVQGQHAQAYNRRRGRHGAYWEDRFHATMIENGSHLWQCLVYIDLNMVRAGVVQHPREWEWTGYHELMGRRKRYRLIELDRVLAAVGAGNLAEFRAHYHHSIEERLACGAMKREPQWTESLAVGSQGFVAQVGSDLVHRRRLEILRLDTAEHSWALREGKSPYD
jgi:putative transposase